MTSTAPRSIMIPCFVSGQRGCSSPKLCDRQLHKPRASINKSRDNKANNTTHQLLASNTKHAGISTPRSTLSNQSEATVSIPMFSAEEQASQPPPPPPLPPTATTTLRTAARGLSMTHGAWKIHHGVSLKQLEPSTRSINKPYNHTEAIKQQRGEPR